MTEQEESLKKLNLVERYLPYYNLAYLMFKLEDEGVESARQYYELGRALGGPVDARIESLLK